MLVRLLATPPLYLFGSAWPWHQYLTIDCGEAEVFSSPLTIVHHRLQKHNEVTVHFSIFLQCKLGIPANPLPYGYWGRGGGSFTNLEASA